MNFPFYPLQIVLLLLHVIVILRRLLCAQCFTDLRYFPFFMSPLACSQAGHSPSQVWITSIHFFCFFSQVSNCHGKLVNPTKPLETPAALKNNPSHSTEVTTLADKWRHRTILGRAWILRQLSSLLPDEPDTSTCLFFTVSPRSQSAQLTPCDQW
jgi:hypothetical protein